MTELLGKEVNTAYVWDFKVWLSMFSFRRGCVKGWIKKCNFAFFVPVIARIFLLFLQKTSQISLKPVKVLSFCQFLSRLPLLKLKGLRLRSASPKKTKTTSRTYLWCLSDKNRHIDPFSPEDLTSLMWPWATSIMTSKCPEMSSNCNF